MNIISILKVSILRFLLSLGQECSNFFFFSNNLKNIFLTAHSKPFSLIVILVLDMVICEIAQLCIEPKLISRGTCSVPLSYYLAHYEAHHRRMLV